MFYKLLAVFLFAVTALAVPSTLVTRDARNCTFSTHITENCTFQGTPTKVTSAEVSNLLTPSMSAVPVPIGDQVISDDPLTIHISSRNELIDGDLYIDALPVDGAYGSDDVKVHFGWKWENPNTHRPETVTWSEEDDGQKTRYGCNYKQHWPKNETSCDMASPMDVRDVVLDCFFKCRGP